MPTARASISTSAVNGKIYAMGGTLGTPWNRGISTAEEYDPETDTWTKKADMPTPRTYFSTSVVNGRIYVIGGYNTSGYNHLSPVEEYDPATDTWTRRADLPTARSGLTTSVVNGKIYAIGGWVGNGTPLSTVEEYDPYPIVVDFNGDGIVDAADVCIMVDYWGTDEPLCDIGPMPWGDGIVGVQDLIVLSEHLFTYPGAVASWALDETEGNIACDNIGGNDGTVIGVSAWQPQGGIVNGALELDGTTFVVTDPVIDPSAGPLSVLAWVKGGAPGQAVIAQEAGANWLMFAQATGALMTELQSGGRRSKALCSDAIITDGNWHRMGFTWDGSARSLYVDDILVAEDTDVALAACDGCVNIGCGKLMAPTTFFTGLIDDVRIYNRAVRP